jgi:hypothetical protein
MSTKDQTMGIHENLLIQIPLRWPSNLKSAVAVLALSPGRERLHREIIESGILPGHAAVVSFKAAAGLPDVPSTALAGGLDTYEWNSGGGAFVICGANPRSTAFGVFALLRHLGLRWLSWLREPQYWEDMAEPIPGRYQWRAAFPVTSAMFTLDAVGYEGLSQCKRQCRWLLFHHWNTYWNYAKIDTSPALGAYVHSFGLDYELGGHILKQAMPRQLFAERPDFFPIVRGGRSAEYGDFAHGNPEAEKIVRREAEGIFRRHCGAEGLHFWYDDIHFGAEDEAAPASWSATRRAAEELRLFGGTHSRHAPGQRLITLAYNGQLLPDRTVQFDPQVKVLFCPRERCQIHSLDGCACNREYLEALKQWVDWLGPERIFYLDYSLDHYLSVSTRRVHPTGKVLAADTQLLAKMGLGSFHTLHFHDFSDVEAALVTSSVMRGAAHPFDYNPARIEDEYFQIAFGPHADLARDLHEMYVPLQAVFLRFDDYRGALKRDMRFAGLEQTGASLRHARLLKHALKTHGVKLEAALSSVVTPSPETPPDCELYRMIHNLRFSLRQITLAAAMLEGVPYLRGENRTPSGRKAWLRAREELIRLKPEVQAMDADPFTAGQWSRSWLSSWSAQSGRCLQFGKVKERD